MHSQESHSIQPAYVPTNNSRVLPAANGAPSSGAERPNASATEPGTLAKTPNGVLPSTLNQGGPYTVGSGDILNISVWHEKELSPTVTVRPDGKVTVPLIGELVVSGLTPLQVEDLLRERLASLVVEPRVTVTVVEIHSRMVYITGEVARPGAYPLNNQLNVLQLIAEAGGLTQFAQRKKILLLRASGATEGTRFDYKQLTAMGDSSRSSALKPGDTVVIP